jgi:hypothetical protein
MAGDEKRIGEKMSGKTGRKRMEKIIQEMSGKTE